MAHFITVGVIVGIVIFFYLLHKILDFLHERDLEIFIGLFIMFISSYIFIYTMVSAYLTINP